MNNETLKMLEYEKIINKIKELAVSEEGREMVGELKPTNDKVMIEKGLLETTEARQLLDSSYRVPLYSLNGMSKIMEKLNIDYTLSSEELVRVAEFVKAASRMRQFMGSKDIICPTIALYALSIMDLDDLSKEINRSIRNGKVDDKASSDLNRIRKKMGILDERLKSKYQTILSSSAYSRYIQDSVISYKGGRFVIPVKKEYKRQINGRIVETSNTGSTVFIEPAAIGKIQDELNELQIEERQEEHSILCQLSNLVSEHHREIAINKEVLTHYDFVFAKGKFSKSVMGHTVDVNYDGITTIKNGRHPLLEGEVVPLNFEIGETYRSLIITGPNTGGKTVVLKTIGLFTLMAQAGLHIPADGGGRMAIYDSIYADIGDGQSIEQNLSTFSSHIKNIIDILNKSNKGSLVILDELGAGTDPTEGMGLATAILETIHDKGSTLLSTTHYSELKAFADKNPGFENGCMAFDVETLMPVYQLHIGKTGESNGFNIALRLGIDRKLIERAHKVSYKEEMDYSTVQERYLNNVPQRSEEASENRTSKCHRESDEINITYARYNQVKKHAHKQRTSVESMEKLKIGDRVYISSLKQYGILQELEDRKGEVVVMIKKKKIKVNKKRVKLHIEGSDLYPDDYDLDIVLESVENRKKKKVMSKKYVKGLQIDIE